MEPTSSKFQSTPLTQRELKVRPATVSTETVLTSESCRKCGKTVSQFTRKSDFNRHVKVCSNGSSFTCNTCLKQFRYNHGLKRHVLSRCSSQKTNGNPASSESVMLPTTTPTAPAQTPNVILRTLTPLQAKGPPSKWKRVACELFPSNEPAKIPKPSLGTKNSQEQNSMCLAVTDRRAKLRQSQPTVVSNLQSSQVRHRTYETVKCAKAIHGHRKVDSLDGNSPRPAAIGLGLALGKASNSRELRTILFSVCKLRAASFDLAQRRNLTLVSTEENLIRSALTLHNYGCSAPLTKRSYIRVRAATIRNKGVPLVPYQQLIKAIVKDQIPCCDFRKNVISSFRECRNSLASVVSAGNYISAAKRKLPAKQGKAEMQVHGLQNKVEKSHCPSSSAEQPSNPITHLVRNMSGAYFDLPEFAQRLCCIYASVHEKLIEAGKPGIIQWTERGKSLFLFRVCVDGTPFRYSFTKTATVVCISLLNLGWLIHAPQHNHFLLVCNLKEDHKLIQHYIGYILLPQAQQMAKRQYSIPGFGLCSIQLEMFCADQKQMNLLAGRYST